METVVDCEITTKQQEEIHSDVLQLNELQLALVGGGIGDVVGH